MGVLQRRRGSGEVTSAFDRCSSASEEILVQRYGYCESGTVGYPGSRFWASVALIPLLSMLDPSL